jgi:cytochrome c-type biogenesis protein CcmH/NrfF
VVQLVDGGYSKPEILEAFRAAYGDRVLMAPVQEGFNRTAYVMPFVALGGAAAVVAVLIRRWTAVARSANAAAPVAPTVAADATANEMARLDAAIRDDSR